MTQQDQIELETVQETILELLQTSPVVQSMVKTEVYQRFPLGVAGIGVEEEITCMVQLLVYRRILDGVAA